MNATRMPILMPLEERTSEPVELSPALRVAVLTTVLALASLPAMLFLDAVPQAAALFGLAYWPHPYFVPQYAGLLYVAVPLVILSSFILLLAPGALLALAAGAGARIESWFLAALALSLVEVSAATAATQAIVGAPLVEGGFIAVVGGCGLASAGVLALVARRRPVALPTPRDALALIPLLVVPLLLFIALEPKFLWEAFNADGADALETARLLLRQPLPFWDPLAKGLATFPGLTSLTFAFPASWFVRLFGAHEVASRLPYLLALAGIYAGVLELARARRDWVPGITARLLVWAGLVPFTLALAYSASYSPYSADIGMPGAQDALLIALFLAAAAAFVEERTRWFALFAVLTVMSMPNGLMLLGLFLPAMLVLQRPRPTRRVLVAGGIVVATMLVLAALPPLLGLLGLPRPGREYSGAGLLRYFAYVQWADWHRLLWLAVSGGIVPALTLFAWRRQDAVARALTAVVAAYFVFFYFQGLTVLHHFSPVMVLPLVVCWRVAAGLPVPTRRRLALAVAAGAVVATGLSLPRVWQPYTTAREVGATVADAVGGYARSDPRAFRRGLLMERVFPTDWNTAMPDSSFGGPALVWTYYGGHPPTGSIANYLIHAQTEPPPGGWRRLAVEEGVALDVRSDAVMAAQRALRPAVDRGSPIYRIPRGMIFSSIPLPGKRIESTLTLLKRLGLDLTPLARRLVPPSS